MTEQEIGQALGVTERTVRRHWEKARLLLAAALERMRAFRSGAVETLEAVLARSVDDAFRQFGSELAGRDDG